MKEKNAHIIPFNKPFLYGNEIRYITEAVQNGKISGDGIFTARCQDLLQRRYGFGKTLLTTSCTDALEMMAILCNLEKGDEIVAPSFTFVSTVNPFVMRGATIQFCDVKPEYPCIDENKIEELINERTKMIVAMHYGGIACDMNKIMEIAKRHNLVVAEDAAHSIDAYYYDRPLGGIGHLSSFSFHETKNIIAGEGGAIVLNDNSFCERAEIIREKGTDRSKFFRGEIDKYSWVDVGSSFLPSEVTAAFLFAQLENIDHIQAKRKLLWNTYYNELQPASDAGWIKLPQIPSFAKHNAHLFYIVTQSEKERASLIRYLQQHDIMAIFHYQPLHSSPFWKENYKGTPLDQTDKFATTLLRLPLYYDLSVEEASYVARKIIDFYGRR
jgi:dTDP-4-amino-4,6-dideoxygalactose transaminase